MQTWARRGLKAALITGGLLMLGTGIASANENVNPDRPASPLDPKVKIPARVHGNAIGTPFGQKNLPNVNRDVVISTDAVSKGLPVAKAAPVVSKAKGVAGKAQAVTGKLPTGRITPGQGDLLRGNKITPHLVVPIEFAGNAIAAGGDAHVNAISSENNTDFSPVWTDGSAGVLAGNVVNLDWALPIRISGNAIAALGKATTHFTSENTTVTGGDIVTSGADSVLSGNVVSGQFATPAAVTRNGVAAAGIAKATTEIQDQAHAPGSIKTNGDRGVVSGTGGGIPIALPAALHGNSVAAGGKSWVLQDNEVDATAGQPFGLDRAQAGHFITTSGKESVLSGTVAEPAVATTATLTCNAATLLGTAECGGGTETLTKAGGSTATNGEKSFGGGSVVAPSAAAPVQAFANSVAGGGLSNVHHVNEDVATSGGNSTTSGKEAVLAGSIIDPAVAGPVEVFGNAVAALGTADTASLNGVVTKAGGNAMTNADKSVASGSVVGGAVALPAEVFGNAAAAGGKASALVGEHKAATAGGDSLVHADESVFGGSSVNPSVAGPAQVLSNTATVLGTGTTDVYNDIVTKAGGSTGTTGNDSVGGGNAATPAVGLPAEVFSNNANLGGLTSSKVAENKVTTAGGPTNTDDDAGVLASNAAVADVAGPLQVFGNSAAGAGISKASVVKHTTAKAGGPAIAKGTGGVGSGNIAAVPVALPTQVFGLAAGVLGKATGWAEGDTSSTAGGPVMTDGKSGTISGNLASVPVAGAAQVFGTAAGIASNLDATGDNSTAAKAGGHVLTSGDDGSIAGNVASLQALPVAQVFGNAAALAGLVGAKGTNNTVVTDGGDITTSGDRGSISGNLADVPVAALAQVFGNAASVGGTAVGLAPNETTAVTGGKDSTSGRGGNLSGNLATVPVAAVAQVFGNAGSVVGNAAGAATNDTKVLSGGDATTNGEQGSISGNLFAVPVAGVAQVFGDAASVGGHAIGVAENDTDVLVGGTYDTEGDFETLSGIRNVTPIGSVVQVFDIPIPIVAHAIAQGTNQTLVRVDETAPIVDLPIGGGNGLAANKLPRLPRRGAQHHQSRSDLPVGSPAGMNDVDVAGLPGGLTAPDVNVVPEIGGSGLNGAVLPNVQDLTSGRALQSPDLAQTLPMTNATKLLPIQQLPVGRSRADLPIESAGGQDVDIAGLPNGTALPNVNLVPKLDGANLNGVELKNIEEITSGSALSSVDATQTLPILNAVRLLPVQPDLGGLPRLA